MPSPSRNWCATALPENWQIGGFGLYLHWPFCQAKCPYCDFNSHVVSAIDQDRWKRAYLAELDRVAVETGDRVLGSVFFGGGTPSLMDADLVAAILDRVRSNWTLANDVEITLEANPTSVEAARFHGYRDAGVNRVSLGIQALNDSDLKKLGRLHSVSEAMNALDVARASFDRVSFDLIYARQDQNLEDWTTELRRALALGVDHLSLYQLTIEPGTAFGDRAAIGKLRGLPDEDLGADMYLATQDLCAEAGLHAYEVSNHARPGQESAHNLTYWRGGDYLGVGPGAHGRIGLDGRRFATDTILSPTGWLTAVERTGSGELSCDPLAPVDQAAEYLMMGLRISEGIDLRRLPAQFNYDLSYKIKDLEESELIQRHDDSLRVTARGRPLLNAIIRQLLPDPA